MHDALEKKYMRQMVVSQMENDRAMMVRMFLRVGQKEINFIWHISAAIGLFFGIIQMGVWLVVPWHCVVAQADNKLLMSTRYATDFTNLA